MEETEAWRMALQDIRAELMKPENLNAIADRIADALIRDLGVDECRRILNC